MAWRIEAETVSLTSIVDAVALASRWRPMAISTAANATTAARTSAAATPSSWVEIRSRQGIESSAAWS